MLGRQPHGFDLHLQAKVQGATRNDRACRARSARLCPAALAVAEIGRPAGVVRTPLAGDVPSPIDPPPGCRFHPRCALASPVCSQRVPQPVVAEAAHAVFAAAGLGSRLRGVAALYPATTRPAAEEPAASLKLPGLVIGAPDDAANVRFNALELARAWPGAVLRTVSKSEATGLAENRRFAKFAGLGGSDRGTQRAVRPLLTGFLLYVLTGDKDYREFADPEIHLPHTDSADPESPPVTTEEKLIALLRR